MTGRHHSTNDIVILQVQLSSDKLGQSVDECDALLKKHEAFERLIATQEEKVRDQLVPVYTGNIIVLVVTLETQPVD